MFGLLDLNVYVGGLFNSFVSNCELITRLLNLDGLQQHLTSKEKKRIFLKKKKKERKSKHRFSEDT